MNGSGNKLLVFDLDETLLKNRFIDVCSEKYNFRQALTLLQQIDKDQISLTFRIAAFLKDKKISDIVEIAVGIPLMEGIQEVVDQLKKRDYIIGIISFSYHFITQYINQKINADFCLANELQVSGQYATGEVLIPTYFHYSDDSTCKHQVRKTNALRYICHKFNTTLENCIVVGNSDNDNCMFRHSGVGITFNNANDLRNGVVVKHINQQAFQELLLYAP